MSYDFSKPQKFTVSVLDNIGKQNLFLAGPLCLAQHQENKDRRLDDDFETFKKFNRSLIYTCETGEPGVLEFTPNSSWPDIVYYNSFTQANVGWKIHIVDSFNQRVYSSGENIKINSLLVILLCLFVRQLL
ncbi:hypothetical protein NQ314_001401 [Rhamnusium bicolor]|uniref:Uncharacterized protein n=1 Tax=Rhamnusium bicolor TaxID=1586634 RepID=A0AAV8ZVE7_9CUCU|nr:hypothetical protein NQ314_001401 [Rhamnusium bicolor]